jgi:diketogulonate reductase-like aldo/keto reductase
LQIVSRQLTTMAAAQKTTVTLNNGAEHPLLVYGTYKVGVVPASASDTGGPPPRSTAEVMKEVLEVGYRALDCAEFYANEVGVGEAIAASGIPRSELFIVDKCWNDTIYAGADAITKQVERSLTELQVDYIDLYLVHWPVPGKHVDCYKTLEKLHAAGKIKAIGLSNYSIEDYEELKAGGITIKPVSNQFELNPFLYRTKTIKYFQDEGLVLQSYRTLRQGKEMSHPVLTGLAGKYGKTVAQLLGRWCVQQGIVYMPKSEKRHRMLENMDVFSFVIDDTDMTALGNMTTQENIDGFKALYEKCVCRDTPIAETMAGVKTSITYN